MKFKSGDIVYTINGPYDHEVTLVVLETTPWGRILVESKENNINPEWMKEEWLELWGE